MDFECSSWWGFFMFLFRCFISLQEWEINSPLIEGRYSLVLQVGKRNRVMEENIKENLVFKWKSHSKGVSRLAVQAFLPELWLLDDSTSPTPSHTHLPHVILEQTCPAFLLFLLPPLPCYSLFEGEVHICVGETNEADRIKDWTEESAEITWS